jgi:hypothetical protein
MNPILRNLLLSTLCACLAGLSGCANMDNVQACNRLSYEQAPPVYERKLALQFNRCVIGMATPGLQARTLGLSANPFFCDQWMQAQDLNYDARRSIFEACRKGQIATGLPAIVQPN